MTVRARRIPAACAEAAGKRHRGDHPARHALGPLRHQDGAASAQSAGQDRRRARPAPSRPGWWTMTALSPKAPRPMPGSWMRTAMSSPAISPTPSCPASPAASCWKRRRRRQLPVVERKFTVAEALRAREAFLSSAIGRGGPGGDDRRQDDREWHARPADPADSRRFMPHKAGIESLSLTRFFSFAIAAIRLCWCQGAA